MIAWAGARTVKEGFLIWVREEDRMEAMEALDISFWTLLGGSMRVHKEFDSQYAVRRSRRIRDWEFMAGLRVLVTESRSSVSLWRMQSKWPPCCCSRGASKLSGTNCDEEGAGGGGSRGRGGEKRGEERSDELKVCPKR